MTTIHEGSVTKGKYRAVDLLPVLAETLFNLDEDRYWDWVGVGGPGVVTHLMVERSFDAPDDESLIQGLVYAYAISEDLTDLGWTWSQSQPLVRSEDNVQVFLRVQTFVYEELSMLVEALNEVALEHGLYFGAHPEDGTILGFWKQRERP